jgi:amino-acid N-acetyltransferase
MTAELPAGVRLRSATEADLPAITRLTAGAGLGAADLATQVESFFVAESEAAVIGAIGLQCFGGDALLRSACIDPVWRGRSVASNLVEHALTEAALEAIDNVYLFTEGAERFFSRFGFITVPPDDLPFTVTRAAERAGASPAGATAMHLRLVEP